jgi:streptogrisin C
MGGVTSWHVDQVNNSVTIEVNRSEGDAAATERFISAAKADSPAVRVVEVARSPRLFEDVRGGDPWYGSGLRCSVGFSAVGSDGSPYMLTAGHCTANPGTVSGYSRAPLGAIRDSVFDDRGDYGDVAVTSGQWALRPWVNTYDGGNVTVTGSMEADIGTSVCRSGSTTGWHCGVVQDTNVTVAYPQGIVSNLTMTDVCAEPGDSGGSWVSGDQAQGMTSGGLGDCTSGGTTYFSPVNQALNDFGLSLVTG